MGLGVSLVEQHSHNFLMHPPIQTKTLCDDIFLKVVVLFKDSFTDSTSVRLKCCDVGCSRMKIPVLFEMDLHFPVRQFTSGPKSRLVCKYWQKHAHMPVSV